MTAAAERGATVIADRVVRRIAERAATESLPGCRIDVRRASASVQGPRATVAVTVSVPYPLALEEAGEAVQAHIGRRAQELTGLTVRPPRVHIAALTPAREGRPSVTSSRFRSTPRAWTDGDADRVRRDGALAPPGGLEVPPDQRTVPDGRRAPRGDGEVTPGGAEPLAGGIRLASKEGRGGATAGRLDVEGGASGEAASDRDQPLRGPALKPSAVRPRRLGRRVWAARRLPAAVVSLLAAVCFALLLSDVVAVHAAGRSPARWRVRLLDELEHHGPGQAGVTVAAAVAVIAGIWLLAFALSPGRRELLAMAPFAPDPGVGGHPGFGPDRDADLGYYLGPGFGSGSEPRLWLRAAVERRTAAVVVRDAVTDVPGVTAVRAKVGRRRVRVRAQIAFGDRAMVRASAVAAAEQALKKLDLVRPPRLRCVVRAAPYWRPAQSGAGPREEAASDGQDT